MGRDMSANIRDMLEFFFSCQVGFFLRLETGFFSVAPGEVDQCLGGDAHGFQFFLFGISLRVVQQIQCGQTALDAGDEIKHSGVVDLVVQHGMAGARCSMNSVKMPAS